MADFPQHEDDMTKATRGMYEWDRCTHEGIGLVGCSTCDPDKHRVAARYEFLLGRLRAERDLAAAERDEFMRQRDRAAEALMAAERTLADVQRLPELPWAEVSASLMQRFAAVARSGHQHDAQALMAVLDKGKTFVVRIEAERDRAKRERDAALREADRLRHGAPVEGDFVCPNERDAREARGQVAALQAEFDAMNRADYTEQECPTCGQKP